MAESGRKAGSAISNSRKNGRTGEGKKGKPQVTMEISQTEKDGIYSSKKEARESEVKGKKYCILAVLSVVLSLVFMYIIGIYAKNNKYSSAFWDTIAEYPGQIFTVLCGGGIVMWIFQKTMEKKHGRKFYILALALGLIAMFIAAVDVATYAKVKAEIAKSQEEEISAVDMKNESDMSEEVWVIVPYDVDEDPFMKNEPLERYLGRTVLETEKISDMVEVIWNNLDSNKPEGSRSENFNMLQELADAEYDTYLYERRRDKQSGSDELFENRIERLQQSIVNRENADKDWETPDNERPIATGYKDKGDELFGRDDQLAAFTAYEKAAEWYIRAICHAAASGNEGEVEKCMEKFLELNEEVEKLNRISETRKNDIETMVQVYDIFTDELLYRN